MHIQFLSRARFTHTYTFSLLISCLIVVIAALLGRATLNLAGALIRKPDIAVLLLLPDEHITNSTLLRESADERSYLVETETGPKLVKLKNGPTQWYVGDVVPLHQ